MTCMPSSWASTLSRSSPVCEKLGACDYLLEIVQIVYLGVVLRDPPIFVARNDVFRQITPSCHSRLALLTRNRQTPLVRLLGIDIDFDIQHHNRSQKPHTLLRHCQQLRPIFRKLYALYCRVEVPHFDAFAAANVPEADGVVGGAAGEEGGGGVDVDGPEGALVAVVSAETFAVGREPGADYLIFGGGEEDVAVFGVSVDRDLAKAIFSACWGTKAHFIWVRDRSCKFGRLACAIFWGLHVGLTWPCSNIGRILMCLL